MCVQLQTTCENYNKGTDGIYQTTKSRKRFSGKNLEAVYSAYKQMALCNTNDQW